MNLVTTNSIVPSPEGIVVYPADKFDLSVIDKLQKAHSNELGFLHTAALEGKLANGEILVAREAASKRFAGYVIGSDTYFKREEVGVIYQMAVHETYRRRQVAALLLRELWASWPRGVKLCCAWCAQDLSANRFWEAMGFVPLAYRNGSEGKGRVHILWQARTTAGDETPWWYPSLTGQGAMREDRVVLPIPLDQHWSETRPAVLPTAPPPRAKAAEAEPFAGVPRKFADGVTEDDQGRLWRDGRRLMTHAMLRSHLGIGEHALYTVPEGVELVAELPKPKGKKAKRTHDPKIQRVVRSLRDDWLEHINRNGLLLPTTTKYAAARQLPAGEKRTLALPLPERRLLAA